MKVYCENCRNLFKGGLAGEEIYQCHGFEGLWLRKGDKIGYNPARLNAKNDCSHFIEKSGE